MSVSTDEFKPMVEGLAKVYGKTLTAEAVKVWFHALRGYSKQEIREACSRVSMQERMMPTPNQVQAIAREIHGEGQAKRFRPFTLADVRPATEYGKACIGIVQQVLDGDLSTDEGVRKTFTLAKGIGVDLTRGEKPERVQEILALQARYAEPAAILGTLNGGKDQT